MTGFGVGEAGKYRSLKFVFAETKDMACAQKLWGICLGANVVLTY